MSLISNEYHCELDGNCYHAVNRYCQDQNPQQCKYSQSRHPSINEYINQMALEDKADFFADVMDCQSCPKKDGCMDMDKRKEQEAHDGCVQRMGEWLQEGIKSNQ